MPITQLPRVSAYIRMVGYIGVIGYRSFIPKNEAKTSSIVGALAGVGFPRKSWDLIRGAYYTTA